LTEEEREAWTDEALERLTPVVRELNQERRDRVWVLMEIDHPIRERFLKK